jgi:hypothetical protein
MSATNSISSRFDLIRPRLRNVFIHLMMSNANRSNEKNIELFIADHSYQYLAHLFKYYDSQRCQIIQGFEVPG